MSLIIWHAEEKIVEEVPNWKSETGRVYWRVRLPPSHSPRKAAPGVGFAKYAAQNLEAQWFRGQNLETKALG
jgi:hypothetical protein